MKNVHMDYNDEVEKEKSHSYSKHDCVGEQPN